MTNHMGKVLSMSLSVTPQVNVHPDISECDAGAAASRENFAQCGQASHQQTSSRWRGKKCVRCSRFSTAMFDTALLLLGADISECDAGAAASRENVAQCGEGVRRPCRWNQSSGYIVGMTSKPWLGGHHTTCCGLQHHHHYIHVNHHQLQNEHVNPHPVASSVLYLSSLANTWHVS